MDNDNAQDTNIEQQAVDLINSATFRETLIESKFQGIKESTPTAQVVNTYHPQNGRRMSFQVKGTEWVIEIPPHGKILDALFRLGDVT